MRKLPFSTSPILLEDLDTRQFAIDDPRDFLTQFPNGAILDEVQHCPALFSCLQTIVDAKLEMGLFVLTGSQQFGLTARITQSLAGRVGFLQLLPFTLDEPHIAPQLNWKPYYLLDYIHLSMTVTERLLVGTVII